MTTIGRKQTFAITSISNKIVSFNSLFKSKIIYFLMAGLAIMSIGCASMGSKKIDPVSSFSYANKSASYTSTKVDHVLSTP